MKRVKLIRRGSDPASPDADFTGLLEDWDDRVFTYADHFRAHRFHGNGKHDTLVTKDFAQAMVAADQAIRARQRVIVYAITSTGRYQALVPSRWDHYAKLWLEKKNAK